MGATVERVQKTSTPHRAAEAPATSPEAKARPDDKTIETAGLPAAEPAAAPTSRPQPDASAAQRTRNRTETTLANHRAWRLQNAVGAMTRVLRNPDRALDAVFKKPLLTERLTRPGDAQSFEVDAEAKGTVSVGNVGAAGLKGKVGANMTIERRDDGDFDVSLKHSATLTKVGDRKQTIAAGERKLGWEGGARVSVTETYTTSPADVEDRAADLMRDRLGDLNALAHGPPGQIADRLLDPSPEDKAALAADWSQTKIEGGGFFRGQLSAKLGQMFGVETTIRDDWVQSGAVEVNRDGDVALTLKLDNDVSLKNGAFAKVNGVEGKLQELSDIEGSETTLRLEWAGIAAGQDPLRVAQGIFSGNVPPPDAVALSNRVQEHDFVERGGAKVTFDGTHAPYTETTTEVRFDTAGAAPHELAALFKGDRAQARRFDPTAQQTVERFSYQGPDVDLKPELKVPKAIKKVVDLSVAAELETGIKKRELRAQTELSPAEAIDQIRARTLAPLRDPLPVTVGGPNSTPRVQEVARSKPDLAWGSTGPAVTEAQSILQEKGYYRGDVDGTFGRRTDRAVRRFQADHGLDEDGIIGDQTWTRLLRRIDHSPPATTATPDSPSLTAPPPASLDAQGPPGSVADPDPVAPRRDLRDGVRSVAEVVVGAPVVATQKLGDALDAASETADSAARALTGRAFEAFGGDKWGRLSDAERDYVIENPRLALAFNHAADRADAVAVERGFTEDGSERGIFGDAGGNAYRHALWNALMVREAFRQDLRIGVSRDDKLSDATREAKAMADAHEANPRNTDVVNMQMDLHNNDVGRQIATEVLRDNRWASEADLAAALEQALVEGRLVRVADEGLRPSSDPR